MQFAYGQTTPPDETLAAADETANPVAAVEEIEKSGETDENDDFAPVIDDDEVTRKIN